MNRMLKLPIVPAVALCLIWKLVAEDVIISLTPSQVVVLPMAVPASVCSKDGLPADVELFFINEYVQPGIPSSTPDTQIRNAPWLGMFGISTSVVPIGMV